MIIILGGDLIGRGEGCASNWWLSVIGGIRCKGIQSRICYCYRKKAELPNYI